MSCSHNYMRTCQTPCGLRINIVLPRQASKFHNDTARMPSQFSLREVGGLNSAQRRVYIEKDGVPASIFHDIPLFSNEEKKVYNMIVEIPRWTNSKMEVSDLECSGVVSADIFPARFPEMKLSIQLSKTSKMGSFATSVIVSLTKATFGTTEP